MLLTLGLIIAGFFVDFDIIPQKRAMSFRPYVYGCVSLSCWWNRYQVVSSVTKDSRIRHLVYSRGIKRGFCFTGTRSQPANWSFIAEAASQVNMTSTGSGDALLTYKVYVLRSTVHQWCEMADLSMQSCTCKSSTDKPWSEDRLSQKNLASAERIQVYVDMFPM